MEAHSSLLLCVKAVLDFCLTQSSPLSPGPPTPPPRSIEVHRPAHCSTYILTTHSTEVAVDVAMYGFTWWRPAPDEASLGRGLGLAARRKSLKASAGGDYDTCACTCACTCTILCRYMARSPPSNKYRRKQSVFTPLPARTCMVEAGSFVDSVLRRCCQSAGKEATALCPAVPMSRSRRMSAPLPVDEATRLARRLARRQLHFTRQPTSWPRCERPAWSHARACRGSTCAERRMAGETAILTYNGRRRGGDGGAARR